MKNREKRRNKILSVFNPYEYLTWHEVYIRLKLPISRNNWDYVDAWEELKALGRIQEGQDLTYRINI